MTNVKKVLFVTTVDKMIWNFITPYIVELQNLGIVVECACSKTSSYFDKLINEKGFVMHEIDFQRNPLSPKNIKAFFQLLCLFKNEKYDLVHSHEPVGGVVGRLVGKLCGAKTIYTVHGFHFYKGAPKLNWIVYYSIEKILSKITDCLITINEEDFNTAIKKKLIGKRIQRIMGIGVDLNKYSIPDEQIKSQLREYYGYDESDFILFFAGEFNYNKHQDLLIRAVKILVNEIPTIKLLLAGDGTKQKEYETLVRSLGVEKNVLFLGYRNDVSDLLKITDIAVSSSRREGLPVNILEAMATGLPLVVTNVRGNRDLVDKGVNGYVVEVNDYKGLSDAIIKIYTNKDLKEYFSSNSFKMIDAYKIENVMKQMNKVYYELLRAER